MSVLGPVLVNVFIHDLELEVEGALTQFAADINQGGVQQICSRAGPLSGA